MPSPGYFICSERAVLDKYTNKVSFFNVLEQLTLKPLGKDGDAIPFEFTAVAYWFIDGSDSPSDKYEHELVLTWPDSKEPKTVQTGEFQFKVHGQRFFASITAIPVLTEGMASVTSRIKKIGSAEWHEQRYFIRCRVDTEPDLAADREHVGE